MSEIKIFNNVEFGDMRTLTIDNEPWFVGKDVAKALGYAKERNAIASHVDNDDKKDAPIQGALGGTQNMTVINESGLYSLILSSKLPSAKKFKKWITSEVLPSIRKHGMYATEELITKIVANPDLGIQLFTDLKKEREARLLAELKVAEQKPMVEVAETRIELKGCFSLTDVTKSLNFKKGQITRWAKACGYIHATLSEVNKAGEKYFKVYSSDRIHNQIGITEEGLKLIESNIDVIKSLKKE